MDNNSAGLRVCSYNFRSVKNSMRDVLRLCESYDIICLQEHWLLPNELNLLSNIHSDFFGCGYSAVDLSADILVGRPYGGTAILYKKSLSKFISVLPSYDSCITSIKIGSLLLLTVYMPTDYNDDDSMDLYYDVCAKITATYSESDSVNIMVIGDMNCQPGSRFFPILSSMLNDNNLLLADMMNMSNVFTYCSDSGACTTWIDHIVCNHDLYGLMNDMNVLLDYVCSDHRPITVTLALNDLRPAVMSCPDSCNRETAADWSQIQNSNVNMYICQLNSS